MKNKVEKQVRKTKGRGGKIVPLHTERKQAEKFLEDRKQSGNYKELDLLSTGSDKNKSFDRAAIICSSGAVFVAFLGLLGWIPSSSFLGNISPGFIPMAPTTSICFILLGLIVLIQIRHRLEGWSRFSAVAVTLLLSVFGIIEFAEHFHTGIDIEDFIITDAGMLGLMRKARMSPSTGATFFLSGLSALFVVLGKNKKKQVRFIFRGSGIVGSLVVIVGLTIIMGYLYGNPLLYGGETIPMAVTTAIGFVFLGVGLVAAAGPDRMPVCLLIGHSSRAKLLRVFLPLSILIVLSQDILHRFVFVFFHINNVLLSVLLLMFFAVITGVIVTVMAGVIGRALDTAQEQLRASEGKYRTLVETMNDGLCVVDARGVAIYANTRYCEILGKTNQEVLGHKVLECVERAEQEVFIDRMAAQARGDMGQYELTFICKDKRRVSTLVSPRPLFDKDGKYEGSFAIITDITERKKAEDELKKERYYLAKAQKIANVGTWETDIIANKILWTNEIYRIFGVPLGTVPTYKLFMDRVHPDDRKFVRAKWANAVSGEPYDTEHRIIVNGKIKWVREKAESFFDGEGKVIRVIGVTQDITERKRTEEELMKTQELTQQFNEMLHVLHEVTNELTKAESTDEVCRLAVELGRKKLGFPRIGIWLKKADPEYIRGTFGIDKNGNICDERDTSHKVRDLKKTPWKNVFFEHEEMSIEHACELHDARGKTVGKGTRVATRIWDGKDSIGIIIVDDLLEPGAITDQQVMLIKSFASTVGHLYSQKCAEEELRQTHESTEQFNEKLRVLHEVTNELTKAESTDEVCRLAVELGRKKLGFPRIGIWLKGSDPEYIRGTFGIDDKGNICDERDLGFKVGDLTKASWKSVFYEQQELIVERDCKLQNAKGKVVGKGSRVSVRIWNGKNSIGIIFVDDLLEPGVITDEQIMIIKSFASTVGHLYSQKCVEEEILEKQKQLRDLTAQLSLSEEHERRRIAEGLHDDIIQPLTFLDVKLKTFLDSGANSELTDSYKRMRTIIGRLINNVRDFTFDLSHPVLYELGFEKAVKQWLISEVKEKHGIDIFFKNDRHEKSLDEDMQTFLFKAVKELLVNVVKHAEATQVKISLSKEHGNIVVRVEDDGIGFSVTKVATKKKRFGLFNIRDRIDHLEGSLDIKSTVGGGTLAVITMPLQR